MGQDMTDAALIDRVRELEISRQRLIDAIEILEDGFVLYDERDRLALCNSKYREIYETSADLIQIGNSFEHIIREGARRGQYAEAVGCEAQWVNDRLKQHRSANSVVEQRLDNGRWLKIAEKRLKDGAVVGFRVDITDYKLTAQALRETHDQLETRIQERTKALKKTNAKLRNEISARRQVELELKRRNEYLSTLHEISIGMFSQTDLSRLLEQIVLRAASLTEIPNGFLHTYDPARKDLVVTAACGHYAPFIGTRTAPGACVAGRVWNNKQPLIVDDYGTWSARDPNPALDVIRAIIAIPLMVGSEIEGVIGLSHGDGEKKIDASLIPVLQQFGELAAMAIHNARLFNKVLEEHDIRLSMEKEKLEIIQKLHHAQKMESIGNLAGGVAHDFNNILTAITGFTELALECAQSGSPAEDYMQEVNTAGKRATKLVRQILEFARQSEEKTKPVHIGAIALEALDFIRAPLPATIDIKQAIETDAVVMGNATQIHQILMNLLTNAAQAMDEKGGTIALSVKEAAIGSGLEKAIPGIKPGNYVQVMVSDTGSGISPEIIDLIFDPYFTTKDRGEGTGLGLATVHGIVESHGGKITVHSALGEGTRFNVYLPASKMRKSRHALDAALPAGSEHILFVDDEIPITKMGSLMLTQLGYSVTTRTSSMEALTLFHDAPRDFDLVITDMTMPNMTGDRLAAELMKIRADIPVILCTGHSKKINEDSALEMGIRAFICKPMVMAEIAKSVRSVLDASRGPMVAQRTLS